MKNVLLTLAAILAVIVLTGCSLSLLKKTPVPTGLAATPTPTSLVAGSSSLQATPTAAPASGQTPAPASPAMAGGLSGPYAVIGVAAEAVLNIRSAPGVGSPAVGSFDPAANAIMRTGPASTVDGMSWVQVQNPNGGTGWVSAIYLTEYVPPASFCADARVAALITNFATALNTSNGQMLSTLVSPLNGWSVRLWRNGNVVVFDRQHVQWVFVSTFEHDWGAAPASGLQTVGSVHALFFPKLLDVFNAPSSGYSLICDAVQTGGASYDTSWPVELTNLNYYSVYKPGAPGSEQSWRTLLIGVEYVQGQPYISTTSQFEWEP